MVTKATTPVYPAVMEITKILYLKACHKKLILDTTTVGQDAGDFVHASTASGEEGDSARLESHRVTPIRECHVQCLQFYYYHSGSESDQLNIWIREFQDEKGLMGQITGPPTSHWKLHHVSLTATKHFQEEFEVRKGDGSYTYLWDNPCKTGTSFVDENNHHLCWTFDWKNIFCIFGRHGIQREFRAPFLSSASKTS
ncbi:hypothetical protein L3Q82_013393 [Scortum barcoo]|uniref:Uncharacterized protein n=1 Tax=Scortum barcoo TaxID=214431 RepID=A0ACB8W0E1_9TELE|nr:hypothetical protein L3Q82_013393 [Scortum barcoo]